MKPKNYLCTLPVLALAALVFELAAHEPVTRARTPLAIPDPPGFVTLKCDFHMHTVFSDGLVWPSIRVEEAWREGLDVIAITDHIEYQPHKNDVNTNHNRSFEIAYSAGTNLDIIVIKGSEITRKMPPGHLNAIFLTNSAALTPTNWLDAIKAARAQGTFLFWNHPGWEAQTTNNLVLWYPEHTQLLENDLLHGIEVVNGRDYYPEAHRWAVEKRLTMFSNSDIHRPLNLDYHVHAGDHRPFTLVFAKNRSPAAIKDALFARRTAVCSGDLLIGDEQFLRPIFEKSIRLNKTKLALKGKQRSLIQVSNDSDLEYQLERTAELKDIVLPKKLVLPGRKTVLLELQGTTTNTTATAKITLPYVVNNLFIGPDQKLPAKLELDIQITPAGK